MKPRRVHHHHRAAQGDHQPGRRKDLAARSGRSPDGPPGDPASRSRSRSRTTSWAKTWLTAIVLREGASLRKRKLANSRRRRLADFKVPRKVLFCRRDTQGSDRQAPAHRPGRQAGSWAELRSESVAIPQQPKGTIAASRFVGGKGKAGEREDFRRLGHPAIVGITGPPRAVAPGPGRPVAAPSNGQAPPVRCAVRADWHSSAVTPRRAAARPFEPAQAETLPPVRI